MEVNSKKKNWRYSFISAVRMIQRGQLKAFASAFVRTLRNAVVSGEEERYKVWIQQNEEDEKDLQVHMLEYKQCKLKPILSFLVFPSGDSARTNRTLNSLKNQIGQNWQALVVTPHPTGTEIREEANQISVIDEHNLPDKVTGDWIGLIRDGDTLSPLAVSKITLIVNSHETLDLIYSDEDVIDNLGQRSSPQFKPQWSPEYLENYPYIGNVCLINRSLLEPGLSFSDQNQEWTRTLAGKPVKVMHVPQVLYHSSRKCTVDIHTVESPLQDPKPSISIVIPTFNREDLLRRCVMSILEKSTYSNYEVLILNNRSTDAKTLEYFQEVQKYRRVRVLDYEQSFNFSSINNFAVSQSQSDFVLFLNNDTEVISPGWMEAMLRYALRTEIGAVGAKLFYPDGTIQHGGIAVGLPDIAVHLHRGFPADSAGYMGRLKAAHNVSAVTAACMMVRRSLFCEAGGFDERLPYAFNDVDFCLRLRKRGFRNVWTPYAELYHHESSTRGYEATIEKQKRLEKETTIFLESWRDELEKGDPYYSPNLSLSDGAFSILI
jgi:GT2 family glycosyltransferase